MTASGGAKERWLLLEIQLPRGTSSARVAVWRRLRRLGAIGLGGATWMLPDGAEERESFEWLRRDIESWGGEALLFEARPVDAEVATTLARRARGETTRPDPEGRDGRLTPLEPADYRGSVWVTRPRPGVDRMASAWLIARFVDAAARFEFADDPVARGGERRVPFDAYGAELGHQQGLCTFEVLVRRFAIRDSAVSALGRVVRAVDLHEAAPEDNEAAMVERVVAGLRAAHADDAELLAAGMRFFEALYLAPDRTPAGRGPAGKRGSSSRRPRRPRTKRSPVKEES